MDETVNPQATQELAATIVAAVNQLQDGLSAVGLDELAAKFSGTFWSMSRNDQVALLAEATAELRRDIPMSGGGHAPTTGVIFDLGDDLPDAERWLASMPMESTRRPPPRFANPGDTEERL